MRSLANLEYKLEVNPSDLMAVDLCLLIVFLSFCSYAHENNLPIVITSITDGANGRKSQTHPDGRAIDISTKSDKWTDFHIERIKYKLNELYGSIYGTMPNIKIKPRVCIHHDTGSGAHFHLQVRRFL